MSQAQILLVEDEMIVAKDVQNRLKNMGYGVVGVAASGEEALQKAAETSPDLVLMDIVLQGNMDGVEAGEHLRRRFQIPTVYLTGYADDTILERAKVTEPFGYLLKPYRERELHTTIEVALYRHRMERKLQETEQWLATTLQAIGDAVITTDSRGAIRLFNPVAEALTGWKAAEAAGQNLTDVFHLIDAQTLELSTQSLTRSLQQGEQVALPADSLLIGKDAEEIPVEGTVSPIHDADGNFTGYVLAFRDITQRKETEEVRRQLEEKLYQAQKMEALGRLAGGVAHDFNNLLTVILGNTSLFLSSLPSAEPSRVSLENVETAALRAADLVKQLVGFSRQAPLRLEPIHLNNAVEDALGMIRRIIDPTITIKMDLSPYSWMVMADPTQIQQVLLNLCLNARDAMPRGGTIDVQTENVVVTADPLGKKPLAQSGEYACLRIRDTGQGIPEEIRSRLFEPFFTTKEPGKGVGLGLAMVFGIIEQHHGWIEHVDVEPGTRFDIYLPRYHDKTESTSPLPSQGEKGRPTAACKPAFYGTATILLADDEPLVRDLGRAILEKKGYRVLLSEDGMKAVDMFQRERHNIDLVILDLTMPTLSGTDTFWKMLAIDPEVRVLFTSGYFAEDFPAAEHDHVLGFIGKPYHPEEMLREVGAALERIRGYRLATA